MIIDDVIWEIIANEHCSYKTKTTTETFCSDPNSLTGLCNRNSCPLANSRYATITEEKGICYLKIKTSERAHTPKELWEVIKLDPSYSKSLEMIDKQLQYWPKFIINKCKMRFTRIRQVLIKRRKIKLEGSQEYKIVSRKAEKRENSRLIKAEKSAVIESHITEELLKNLKNGKYDEIYNYPQKNFNQVLEKEHAVEDVEEDYNEDDYDKGYIEDFSGEDNEGLDDEEGDGDDFEEGDIDKLIKENKDDKEDDKDDVDRDIDDIFNDGDNKVNMVKGKKEDKKFTGKKRKGKKNKYEYEKEYETGKKNTNVLEVDF